MKHGRPNSLKHTHVIACECLLPPCKNEESDALVETFSVEDCLSDNFDPSTSWKTVFLHVWRTCLGNMRLWACED